MTTGGDGKQDSRIESPLSRGRLLGAVGVAGAAAFVVVIGNALRRYFRESGVARNGAEYPERFGYTRSSVRREELATAIELANDVVDPALRLALVPSWRATSKSGFESIPVYAISGPISRSEGIFMPLLHEIGHLRGHHPGGYMPQGSGPALNLQNNPAKEFEREADQFAANQIREAARTRGDRAFAASQLQLALSSITYNFTVWQVTEQFGTSGRSKTKRPFSTGYRTVRPWNSPTGM